MNWTEKMEQAMKLIIEACTENPSWNDCENCPFDRACTIINNHLIETKKDFFSMGEFFEKELDIYHEV